MMRSFESVRFGTLMGVLAACLLGFCLCGPARATATLPGAYTTSWMDNTLPGWPGCATGSNLNYDHILQSIAALYVAPDGYCYTNTLWDEGAMEASIFSSAGKLVGNCEGIHQWPSNTQGGISINSDGSYIWVAMYESGSAGYNSSTLNGNSLPAYPPYNSSTEAATDWYAIGRFTFNGTPAPFSAGYGLGDNMIVVTTAVNAANPGNYVLPGIAYSSKAGYLYVSDYQDGVIEAYSDSTPSQTPATSYNVAHPGALAVDGSGNLWALEYSGSPYSALGTPLFGLFSGLTTCTLTSVTGGLGSITFAAADHPVAVAYNPSTGNSYSGTLMVVDQGPDQNIKCYNPTSFSGSPTTVLATFGVLNGVYEGAGSSGLLMPQCFNMPSGVGADTNGNIYVSQNGGTAGSGSAVLESYGALYGNRNWNVNGTSFMTTATIDPLSATNAYTPDSMMTVNWSNTTPGTEATTAAYTCNPFLFPEDERFHGTWSASCAYRRSFDGAAFQFVNFGWNMEVYRYQTTTYGYVAIPCAMFGPCYSSSAPAFTPDTSGWPENEPGVGSNGGYDGEWIWTDANGNGQMDAGEYAQPTPANAWYGQFMGWYVDSNGDVWQSEWTPNAQGNIQIREYLCPALNSAGVPQYSYTNMNTYTAPAAFSGTGAEIHRIQYNATTDTMYISGFSSAYPDPGFLWDSCGEVLYAYSHWSTTPTLVSGYPIVLPFSYGNYWPMAWDIAGNYLFVSMFQYNQIYVYNVTTGGAAIGIISPSSDIGGNPGVAAGTTNCAGMCDQSYGIQAYQNSNGEYDVLCEDDAFNKVVIYRWIPAPSGAPAAPTALVATPGYGTVNLTWQGMADATTYNVYRGTASGGETLLKSGVAYQYPTYLDSTVTNGTKYYYEIKAADGSTLSAYSTEVSATPTATQVLTDANFATDPLLGGTIWGCPQSWIWASTGEGSSTHSMECPPAASGGLLDTGTNLPVSGSTPYKLGGWVKTSSVNEEINIQCVFFDSAGNQTEGSLNTSYITGTNGWTYLTASGYTPPCASTAWFLCPVPGGDTGTAYFDNFVLAPGF